MFLAEGREHLQELNLAVVRIEETPDDRQTVDEIFRIAHSLKGMSATMGFAGMAALTHEMEDVFELLRQRKHGLQRAEIDVCLECLDALEAAVDAIETGGAEEITPEPLIERLRALIRDDHESPEESAPPSALDPPTDLSEMAQGRRVVQIAVTLRADVDMPSVRAYMVLAAVAKLGETLACVPSPADVDTFVGRDVIAWVVSENTDGELHSAAVGVPDVATCEVTEAVADAAVDGVEESDAVAASAATPASKPDNTNRPHHGSSTVRVDAERLDQLMHAMGELVLNRTQVEVLATQADVPGLQQAIQGLTRTSHALQSMVMQVRMIPVEAVLLRFPRLVRDLSVKLSKQVELELIGKDTELDRSVVDSLGDPLVHLIRNSLDHGLEPPADRIAAGKPPTGTLTIAARHAGGSIAITVKDDGRGIDPARVAAVAVDRGLITREQAQLIDMRGAIELLFAPGFSTAAEVGALSGRGVGMDAVREKIRELGGEVTVTSVQGEGTVNEIRLPLTLAIMSALLVEAGARPFGIPLQRVERTMRLDDHPVRSVAGRKMLVLKDEALPLRRAVDVFGAAAGTAADAEAPDTHVVIVRGVEGSIALSVSKLIGQRELVTRPLPPNVAQKAAVSGAAVLSNGDIVLLADCDALTLNTHPALSAGERPTLAAAV
ncbi:MAG TPA: chemotaxis protein CheA [Baekduia sp.]|uniref:chemotaxis protein CheA n=1 Tax=Baekduia sp. TaxID=2600305 RepID=UPI002D11DF5C|nr:chemotaxis protein CheA [Baekduia sp.]HMJ33126.1 chemotaxis protein CheA [Baekduia sp.]